jgi:hypothetical protein
MMNERVPQLVSVKVADAKPGEIDEAERVLRAAIEHDGTRTDAVFELAMILYAKRSTPSETPLSDLISLVLADPSSSQALAAFHQAVLESMVGVIAVGGPPGHVGEYRAAAGDLQLASTRAPDGAPCSLPAPIAPPL